MTESTRRYVIVGSVGQLGRDLCSQLSGQVVPLTRKELELTNAAGVRATLTALQPDVVINCAAYNFVDKAEDEAEMAFAVNALGPRLLADACNDLDAVLVHFSTDYAFGLDTNRRTPYRESDVPGPLNLYGISKLAGEYAVRSRCPRHLVIRTCGLYGRWGSGGKGGNFVETMLRIARQGKPLRVVYDQVCTPSYTVDVAAAAIQLLGVNATGLFHLTNAGQCSWYELAQSIFALRGVAADLTPITTQEYGSRARRPAYSVLTSEHPQTPQLRPWQEALTAYLTSK
jgi:dTDP-4-dehydrorhamnose reductase